MTTTVAIAVRPLVEYAYLSGDIESGFRTATALTEGTKAHQRVQSRYGERDQKEVYVKGEVACEELLFVIDGRCDGVLEAEDGAITIDEIKSTSGDLAHIDEDRYPVHWAQAYCYAFIVARERGLAAICVQLTYVQVDSEAEKRFKRELTAAELEAFVHETVNKYAPYARMRAAHETARDASIRELPFPFPAYRSGQRKFAGAVYKSIEAGTKLFAKAPTGTGKTISTLFPAIKAFGAGLLQRLFYLTARTITRTAAEEALALMETRGLRMHAVTITAKEKVCFQEEVRCSPEHCPYADGYYDRVNGAVLDMLEHETIMTRTVIEGYARKHRVCPFEFSLDAAYAADAVICDYNYVFDPRVSLKRQFEEQKRRTALLVDEAHNLVDRAREMYSAELAKGMFLELSRAFKTTEREVAAAAKAVNDHLLARRKAIGERLTEVETAKPEPLLALVESFSAAAERYLARGGGEDGSEAGAQLLDAFFAAQAFLRTAKLYDEEHHVTYTECFKSEVRVRMFCLDPSQQLRQMTKGYRSQIMFSATLSPLTYYMDMLGGGEEDYSVAIPSPFSAEQLDARLVPLSTRYQDRERTREPLAELLAEKARGHDGNGLFFFPSYAYMEDIYERFAALLGPQIEGGKMDVIVQRTAMTEEERERFLASFEAERGVPLFGFAVMGGIFSEGVDLVGDRLTLVGIVGVGLPQIGFERDLLKAHFDRTRGSGFEYAYVIPGMNKVLQAGGRLIRSEDDRGTLLLIDDRYRQPQYRRLLPEEWRLGGEDAGEWAYYR
ncbi:helicase C-terminal domain-containing protein [Paenibacillus aurantiacus]|uniref:Helicase C-terminal domain-containing protein n=1 Tax=Paenibacillus aurantiacus TaxID=1936118 RepID=A0ABV5KNN7_9BACL